MSPPTFDEVLPRLRQLLQEQASLLRPLGPLYVVRDLWGKVRLILTRRPPENDARRLATFAAAVSEALSPHGYSPDETILYADDLGTPVPEERVALAIPGLESTFLIDRQVTGLSWSHISKTASPHPTRLAFYSLKGGVGRSTAAAMAAWHLAGRGKKVLVVDFDLEAPGLSTTLVPEDRQPAYGVVDWLVEDLVGAADRLLPDITSQSPIAEGLAGSVIVLPSHGKEPGEYLPKLGRATLPGILNGNDGEEPWEGRVQRMLTAVEARHRPDIVLLDSRAGLHDLASTVVTDLDAELLLFGLDTAQTWRAYELLFGHWLSAGLGPQIRGRMQMIAALVPETDRPKYLRSFCEKSWDLFREHLYDEAPPALTDEAFTFDLDDQEAPHFPVPIYWNRGFASLSSFKDVDSQQIRGVYQPFFDAIDRLCRLEAP